MAMHTITTITDALMVEPQHVFAMGDGAVARRSDVLICHPQLGWGRVDVLNSTQMRVRFETALVWFSLASEALAHWPVENAAELYRWCLRVKAALPATTEGGQS